MKTILVVHDDDDLKNVWTIGVEHRNAIHIWEAISDALDKYSETEECYSWCVEQDAPCISILDFEDVPFEFFEEYGILSMSFLYSSDGYLSEVTAQCEKFDNSKED